ncbi:efflux RND transporter periplasmic adaptor subunit [Anaeromyxobacter sp. SG64]|uniref:efflux RND transporter periplasmic adaptor subunit n=1 Tax=Anaeromyxobacter sp. SG64 TaxID=2925409 RepID=UPI001F58D72C|nr:efflux RND transporter periplasmic adaptor subunit [Anaeromyxobacter sp. SG64]
MSRKTLILIAAALAVLVAAGGIWRWRAGAADAEPKLETARVDRGRIVAKVTATGTLSALVTVQVGSQVSGRVAALFADFNTPVKKGQVIARIDPQLFQAAVEQARANTVAAEGNLAKARAQAADAERQLRRSEALAAKNLIAGADLDTARANADGARAGVQAAQGTLAQTRAALHQAEVNLAYTQIASPTDGVVISRNVDVGQTVAASLQAPTLFVIAEDLAKMQVDTNVAEADVGRLRAGMTATFTVDAYPGEAFSGAVRQVRNAPQTVQNVVTYDAVVDVPNGDLKLKPGMTATVTFVYAEKDDVVRIPNAALRFRAPPGFGQAEGASGGAARGDARAATPAGTAGQGANGPRGAGAGRGSGRAGDRSVWVVRAGRPVQVPVVLGVSDGSLTELVKGEVQPGDAVVTEAQAARSGGAPGGGFPGGGRRGPF